MVGREGREGREGRLALGWLEGSEGCRKRRKFAERDPHVLENLGVGIVWRAVGKLGYRAARWGPRPCREVRTYRELRRIAHRGGGNGVARGARRLDGREGGGQLGGRGVSWLFIESAVVGGQPTRSSSKKGRAPRDRAPAHARVHLSEYHANQMAGPNQSQLHGRTRHLARGGGRQASGRRPARVAPPRFIVARRAKSGCESSDVAAVRDGYAPWRWCGGGRRCDRRSRRRPRRPRTWQPTSDSSFPCACRRRGRRINGRGCDRPGYFHSFHEKKAKKTKPKSNNLCNSPRSRSTWPKRTCISASATS